MPVATVIASGEKSFCARPYKRPTGRSTATVDSVAASAASAHRSGPVERRAVWRSAHHAMTVHRLEHDDRDVDERAHRRA